MDTIRGKFYYSVKQSKVLPISRRTFALLDNGKEVEYTEWVRPDRDGPLGKRDDYKYLGEGKVSRIEQQ